MLAVLLTVGYLAVTRLHVLGAGNALVVKAARVTVDQASGHCPTSSYNFTGRVSSNGAGGRITYQWIKPDGTTTNTAAANIQGGQKVWTARLLFTFQGHGQATGDAILRVISPTEIKSAPARVQYLCP